MNKLEEKKWLSRSFPRDRQEQQRNIVVSTEKAVTMQPEAETTCPGRRQPRYPIGQHQPRLSHTQKQVASMSLESTDRLEAGVLRSTKRLGLS